MTLPDTSAFLKKPKNLKTTYSQKTVTKFKDDSQALLKENIIPQRFLVDGDVHRRDDTTSSALIGARGRLLFPRRIEGPLRGTSWTARRDDGEGSPGPEWFINGSRGGTHANFQPRELAVPPSERRKNTRPSPLSYVYLSSSVSPVARGRNATFFRRLSHLTWRACKGRWVAL